VQACLGRDASFLPFGLGWAGLASNKPGQRFCWSSMTATSIGISAKVLADLGYLRRPRARLPWQQSLMMILGVVLLGRAGIAGGATWNL